MSTPAKQMSTWVSWRDNISDIALRAFRMRYNDNTITKDDVFYYVYGVLQTPGYRERFANDLVNELPRIPIAADFQAFAIAGQSLAELHLGYETCAEYPLQMEFAQSGKPRPEHFRIGEKAMRFADKEKTVLIINDHIRLAGIPVEAHAYQVNGDHPQMTVGVEGLTPDLGVLSSGVFGLGCGFAHFIPPAPAFAAAAPPKFSPA